MALDGLQALQLGFEFFRAAHGQGNGGHKVRVQFS
jgi:hypothetical protein